VRLLRATVSPAGVSGFALQAAKTVLSPWLYCLSGLLPTNHWIPRCTCGGILSVTHGTAGIGIENAVLLPFRVGHAPLPWAEILINVLAVLASLKFKLTSPREKY